MGKAPTAAFSLALLLASKSEHCDLDCIMTSLLIGGSLTLENVFVAFQLSLSKVACGISLSFVVLENLMDSCAFLSCRASRV